MVSVKNNAQGREKKKREINGLYRNTRTAALVREEEKEIECTEAERERKKKTRGKTRERAEVIRPCRAILLPLGRTLFSPLLHPPLKKNELMIQWIQV